MRHFIAAMILFVSSVAGAQGVSNNLDSEATFDLDSRELQRESRRMEIRQNSRWWIVSVNQDGLFLVDRYSLLSPNSTMREGWWQLIFLDDNGVGVSMMSHAHWDCERRRVTTLSRRLIDRSGRSENDSELRQLAEPVLPETPLENILEFVCDLEWHATGFPIPVARNVRTLADVVITMYPDREMSIFGLLMASLDPIIDRAQIVESTEIFPEPMRSRYRSALLGAGN